MEGAEQSLRSWGYGVTAGAGVEYHFSPRFAVDLGVTHTQGRITAPTPPGEAVFRENFSSNRMQVGFTWRP
jgi:opacity protein-like surface antigen